MKKILNFSLCILLALSLTLGNVAPVANANSYWNNNESEASDENDQETRYYDHIDVRVNAQVKLTTKLIQSGEEKVIKTETKDATVTELLVEADGKKVTFEQQVIHGEGTEAPEIPEELNDGRKFISWDSDDYIANVTKNLTINANYEYKVTFVDGNNVIEEQYVKPGESATAPEDPTKEGYEFIGWDKDFSNVEEDLTVTAQYKALPTEEPTEEETTEEPTAVATATPTAVATASPTAIPTVKPTATPTTVPTEEPKEELTPIEVLTKFYLLVPGLLQPEEPKSHSVNNYVCVGDGVVSVTEGAICGDAVKNHIKEEPDVASIKDTLRATADNQKEKEKKRENANDLFNLLNDGWSVRWYVIKHEGDGWHVDGILEKPTTTTGPAITPTAVATATPTAVATATPTAVPTTTPSGEVEPEPTETESAAPIATPVVTVTPSAVPTVTPNAVTGTATPVPSVTPGAVATATPGAVTGAATTATPGAVTGAATTATPGAVTGTATPDPTTTPGNNNPIIPNGNPVNPQNPPNSENKTPTATPSNGTDKEDGKEEDSDTSDGKEDSDTNDVNAGTTATPSTDVEIKEDQIPGDASQATAVPSVEPSVTPTTEPTVTPTEKVEATANPDQKEDITVQDTTLPNTAPDSDEETDGNDNATEKDDAVEIEEDDIANSGAEVDEEDADQDAEAEDESEEDDDESTDAEEVEEDEIANALPQTGVMSENVFYYIGSMICAFGICVLAFIRRKTMK